MDYSRAIGYRPTGFHAFPELAPPESASGEALVTLRPAPVVAHAPVPQPQVGQLRSTVLSFRNIHIHGDLLVQYLAARKRVFIDHLHWNVPHVDGMEFDQYDNPLCRWVVVHEFGEVLGGIRLTPTTATVGCYSYMLRDAQRGLLTDIPHDVLFFEAPVSPVIWEASRLFIAEEVPAQRRMQVQAVLMDMLSSTAFELGASHVIGIVPAVWSRWLRRLDLDAVPVGPRFTIDGTSSQAALFSTGGRKH